MEEPGEAYYVDLAIRTVHHHIKDTDLPPPHIGHPHREAYLKAFRETRTSIREKDLSYFYTHCSKCGGEFDSEGWCPNYCTNEE